VIRNTTIFVAIAMLGSVVGCSRWSIERYDGETSMRIDANLSIGMTSTEFRSAFPDAESMGRDTWLVDVQEVCFWCHSGRGFRQSEEVFARVVTFEDGHLAEIAALPGVRP
jgi:hypothetical protein